MHKGQRFYVSCKELNTQDSKEASWQAANAWWERKVGQLQPKAGTPEALLAFFQKRIVGGELQHMQAALALLNGNAPQVLQDEFQQALLGPQKVEQIEANVTALLTCGEPSKPLPDTIGQFADQWKELQKARVKDGSITATRTRNNFDCLEKFVAWIGKHTPATVLTEPKWQEWYHAILAMSYSPSYKKRIWQVSKRLIEYLVQMRAIESPRNLNSKDFRFKVPSKEVNTLNVKEIKRFLDIATIGQSKLHVLLMLNCGMTQKDISDLQQDEVDWRNGIIQRKRSKTDEHENVPKVRYKLWPETFARLKQHRSKGDTVLLTKSGKTWIQGDNLKENDKLNRSDNVATNIKAAQKNLPKNERVSLKMLRSASHTLLANHPQHHRFAVYFLGHAPRTVAEKHYTKVDDAEFFKAIEWLRKQILG